MIVANVTNHADGVVHVDGKPAYKVISFIGGGNAGRVHSVERLDDGMVSRFQRMRSPQSEPFAAKPCVSAACGRGLCDAVCLRSGRRIERGLA